MRRTPDDMIDAFAYSIEALKQEKSRRLKHHRLFMIALALAAIAIGFLMGWVLR